jgi:hypothetical protein
MTIAGCAIRIIGSKGWLELWLIQEILKFEKGYHRSQGRRIATVIALIMTRRLMDSRMTIGFVKRLMRIFLEVMLTIVMRCMMIRVLMLLTNGSRRHDRSISNSIHDRTFFFDCNLKVATMS